MNGRWPEEEFLLGYDKYSLDMYFNDESDLHRSSSDRDVPYEHMRRKGTQKKYYFIVQYGKKIIILFIC